VKIAKASALTGLTPKNIRFYEEQGLLQPTRNPDNGYRDYTEEDVQNLLEIHSLRKAGVCVSDIREYLLGVFSKQEILDAALKRIQEEIENLNKSKEVCKRMLTEG